jgi:hypothetical protein
LRRLTNGDSVDLRRASAGERLMMGRREGKQGQFFYSFDLDKAVPSDHLVRQIDGVLDLGWVHKELAAYYSHTGRPSIDSVDDPHVDRGLRVRDPVGAAAVR